MKYGVCSWVLWVEDYECFEIAKKYKLDGVALEIQFDGEKLNFDNKEKRGRFVQQSRDTGIEMCTMSQNYLCDIEVYRDGYEEKVKSYLKLSVEICKEMGVGMLQYPSFYYSYIDSEKKFLKTYEYLNYLCSIAKEHNITVGWENALDYEENMRMKKLIDSKNFVLYFDSENPREMSGIDSFELAKKLVGESVELHAKDSYFNDPPIYERVLEVFANSDYNGYVLLESPYKEHPNYSEKLMARDLDNVKRIFGDR